MLVANTLFPWARENVTKTKSASYFCFIELLVQSLSLTNTLNITMSGTCHVLGILPWKSFFSYQIEIIEKTKGVAPKRCPRTHKQRAEGISCGVGYLATSGRDKLSQDLRSKPAGPTGSRELTPRTSITDSDGLTGEDSDLSFTVNYALVSRRGRQ